MISATLRILKARRNIYLAVLLLPMFFLWLSPVSALTIERTADFTSKDLKKDVSVNSLGDELKVTVKANSITEPISLKVKQLDLSDFVIPANWEVSSEIYSYEIVARSVKISPKVDLVFHLRESWTELKKIFVYNEGKAVFEEYGSISLDDYTVKGTLSVKKAIVVVLTDMTRLSYGEASWYKYKGCDCAASPDYPKGTLLKVTNLENGKEVIVKVNDYGPDRSIFPNRIIDLDKVAFKKLGSLSSGILKKIVVTKIK